MLPIGSIFRKFDVSYHCYADDTQLYIPIKRNDKSAFYQLTAGLQELKAWLTNNFLHLNDDKTQIILFRPNEKTDLSTVDLGSLSPYYSSEVKDLGFILDSDLRLNKQINYTVSASFYHLRRLAKVKPFLSRKSFEIIIHAFISSRLDYCNSLYLWAACSQLFIVYNWSKMRLPRLLTGSRRRNDITPILCSLHWLLISYRIQFKILLFVYKALNNLAPPYLSELIVVHNPARSLRSQTKHLLLVPRARLKCRGDRAFAVAGPKLWNNLPLSIRQLLRCLSLKVS